MQAASSESALTPDPPNNFMNAKLLPGFILVLAGLLWAIGSMAQQPDATKDNTLHWGEMVGGFQMAAILDETNGFIHCLVRNATTNEMNFSSFDFGYFENIALEIHGATNWTKSKYWPAVLPRSFGAYDAFPNLIKCIHPGQIVTATYIRGRSMPWPVQKFEEYLKWTKGDTNEALLTEKLNQWYASRDVLEAAMGRNDTFAIDLFEMEQLASLPRTDSLEVRVSQSFRTNSYGEMTTVYSPGFILSNSLLQSCAKENYALHVRRAVKKP